MAHSYRFPYTDQNGRPCGWSAHEHCFVYPDGSRVPQERQPRSSSRPTFINAAAFNTVAPSSSTEARTYTHSVSSRHGQGSPASSSQQPAASQSSFSMGSIAGTLSQQPQQSVPAIKSKTVDGPPPNITPLDAGYKVRKPKFFKYMRVFTAWWPELAGPQNDTDSLFSVRGPYTQEQTHGEWIYCKIRWFVVIRPMHNYCICLPISTYRGWGVEKLNTVKAHHSVIYTGTTIPSIRQGEQANPGEQGLRTSIRVLADDPSTKLDPMSRLHYGSFYTVHYNVKAKAFGQIHDKSLQVFRAEYEEVDKMMSTPLSIPPHGSVKASSSNPKRRQVAAQDVQGESSEEDSDEESSEGDSTDVDEDS